MAGSFDRAAILESFLKELGGYIPEIETHLDRLQRRANDVEAAEEIYRRVHTIAGAAAMMELVGIAQIGSAMEAVMGDVLDGRRQLDEPTLVVLRHSLGRLRQMMDLVRTGGDDAALAAQDGAEYMALRGVRPAFDASSPAFPAAASGVTPMPASPNTWQAERGAIADEHTAALPAMPAAGNAVVMTRLTDTSVWRETRTDEAQVRQAAGALVESLGALRTLGTRFDAERNELNTFLDGSKDALDRLERWAGAAMGIDLRTSPDHVRRYLPLSVLWVVTARMKQVATTLHDTTNNLTARQEQLNDSLIHLRAALDQLGQFSSGAIAAAGPTANGGFAASVAQFSWTPPAQSGQDLRPAAKAEMERLVREDLRRELEEEVRAEVAATVRQEEERRLRQELEIQLRRQWLAEIDPALGNGSRSSTPAGVNLGAINAQGPLNRNAPRSVVATTDQEAVAVFRAEADEHLRTISVGMDRLEHHPEDRDAIQSVRRAVHTLKGAAGITGFTLVADLAHICEDVLDRVSDGSIAPTPDVISLILDTAQALEAMVSGDTAEQGGEFGMLAALRPRYETLLGDTIELGVTPKPQPVVKATAPRAVAVPAEHADDDLERDANASGIRPPTEKSAVEDLSVRLPLRRLDDLIALFGDLLVNRSVVEERVERISRMIGENAQVDDRLREVGRDLERQFEAALLPSRRPAPGQSAFANPRQMPPNFGGVVSGPNAQPTHTDFDPLELDRYSDFHRLTRGLSEGIADATTLNNELEAAIREAEVAIARESRLSSIFQDALLKVRLVPISSLVPRLYRAIQAVGVKYGKEFELLIEGEDTEVDRGVYEDIAGPLLHLVRNAIFHGIELPHVREASGKTRKGHILLSARYEGSQIVISVRDDGAGLNIQHIRATALARGLIDAYTQPSTSEILNLIFQPGFSTTDTVTEEAGRGVGLDVVRDTVTRLRGSVEVDSTEGKGSTFTLKLPISLQIQRVVLIRASDQTYAIPMVTVEQLGQLDFYTRSRSGDVPAVEVRGESYPLVHLATYLRLPPGQVNDKTPVLLLNSGQRRWALLVDAIVGRQEIVAKTLGPHLRNVPAISGATVLGNGQVMLIIDPVELLSKPPRAGAIAPTIPPPGTQPTAGAIPSDGRSGGRMGVRGSDVGGSARPARPIGQALPDQRIAPYLLVVDDSPSVRRVVSATLNRAGWEVLTARDGAEALEIVAKRIPVGILLDIEMPRMDGYELMAALRAQPMYQQIPLIVLTSRAATKHQQRALQLGADAYVVKPYQDEELLGTIHELVPVRPNGEPR